METTENTHSELSYPIGVTHWDGKIITMISEKKIHEQMDVFRKVGIRWVMPAGLQLEEPADFNMSKGAALIGRILEQNDFRISSHHCMLNTYAPLTQSQQATRDKMLKTVEFCATLKANTLVIHAGRIDRKHKTVDTIFEGFESEVSEHGIDNVLDTVAENLRIMGESAQRANLKLALENLSRFGPLGSFDTLPELVKRIDLPNVGFCLDSGHAHVFGESVDKWIEIMGDKLFTTHLHDNRGLLRESGSDGPFVSATKEQDEHLSPGFGTIDWFSVINSLRKIGYPFPVNFETGGWPGEDPVESYRHAINWWRTCEDLAEKAANCKN